MYGLPYDLPICGLADSSLHRQTTKPALPSRPPEAKPQPTPKPHPLKGRKLSPETKTNISKALKGRIHSPESNAKRAVSIRRFWDEHPEARAEAARKQTGRIASPQSRLKRSKALKGRKQSPEHIAKRAAAVAKTLARKKAQQQQHKE